MTPAKLLWWALALPSKQLPVMDVNAQSHQRNRFTWRLFHFLLTQLLLLLSPVSRRPVRGQRLLPAADHSSAHNHPPGPPGPFLTRPLYRKRASETAAPSRLIPHLMKLCGRLSITATLLSRGLPPPAGDAATIPKAIRRRRLGRPPSVRSGLGGGEPAAQAWNSHANKTPSNISDCSLLQIIRTDVTQSEM